MPRNATIKYAEPIVEFDEGIKISAEQKAYAWSVIMPDPSITSRVILEKVVSISITVRHLNRIRNQWGCSRGKGRPRKTDISKPSTKPSEVVRLEPNIQYIGVHVFALWLEQQQIFTEIVMSLRCAIQDYTMNHPMESFPLLQHRDETLMLRFKAIFFAPLFGIGKLIEYDVKEHPLRTMIGRGYQSSTLNQFLGQLERIDAGPDLMSALLPSQAKGLCYIDGHMIAFWSRTSMHKGKITMLGRIMAGSQAVVAHSEDGHAMWVEYFPPDTRLPRMIIDYCEKIASLTGIDLFVIDREINSEAMASAFTKNEWGLLSMLDKNEYKDLSDWKTELVGTFEGGVEVYEGRFSDEEKKDDPRIFALVVQDGKILPFWGTEKFKEKVDIIKWPNIYSRRTEVQENRFKHMINHGALNVNFGTKKIISTDRHHQRVLDSLKEKSETLGQKIEKKREQILQQEAKVNESRSKGHTKRLDQRLERMQKMTEDLDSVVEVQRKNEETINEAGPAGTRGDRDFRKQTIMTLRTLLLENMLLSFMSALRTCLSLPITIGLDSVLELFFNRSGACIKTPSEIIFLMNMEGLSKQKVEIMEILIGGVNKMGLMIDGKPVRIRSRSRPAP